MLADSALSLSWLCDGPGPVFPAVHEVTAAAGHGHGQVQCPVLGRWPGSSWTHSGPVPRGPLAPLLPPGVPWQPWGWGRGGNFVKLPKPSRLTLDAREVRGRGSQPGWRGGRHRLGRGGGRPAALTAAPPVMQPPPTWELVPGVPMLRGWERGAGGGGGLPPCAPHPGPAGR